MKMLTIDIAFVSLVFLLGCGDQTNLTAPGGSQLGVAGNSGCYTVKLTTVLTPSGAVSFSGIVTGDLEGTVDIVFDEFHRFTGVTRLVAANATWHITGGIIPELIGETFETRLTNRNIFLPGTSLVKNIGSLRALGGVEKANLTFVGETSLATLETRLDFNGVICPA